jgi:hypothetical protein
LIFDIQSQVQVVKSTPEGSVKINDNIKVLNIQLAFIKSNYEVMIYRLLLGNSDHALLISNPQKRITTMEKQTDSFHRVTATIIIISGSNNNQIANIIYRQSHQVLLFILQTYVAV